MAQFKKIHIEGQWLQHSWQCGRFRCQSTRVRIESLAKISIEHLLIVNCIEKTKTKEKEVGNGQLKIPIEGRGGGQMVSLLPFYSDNPSLNPAEVKKIL